MTSQPLRFPELSSRRMRSSSVPCLYRSASCLVIPSSMQSIGRRESNSTSYRLSIGAADLRGQGGYELCLLGGTVKSGGRRSATADERPRRNNRRRRRIDASLRDSCCRPRARIHAPEVSHMRSSPTRDKPAQAQTSRVQRVKSGEGDELKLRNRSVVEFLLPVERRRTVVRQQLARILLVDRVSESTRVLHVWFRRFAPDDVCVRRVSQCARNRLVQLRFDGEETFGSPASGKKRMVALVNVAREQAGTVCVCSRDHDRVHSEHVGCKTRCNQFVNKLLRRYEHLAAPVAAL